MRLELESSQIHFCPWEFIEPTDEKDALHSSHRALPPLKSLTQVNWGVSWKAGNDGQSTGPDGG